MNKRSLSRQVFFSTSSAGSAPSNDSSLPSHPPASTLDDTTSRRKLLSSLPVDPNLIKHIEALDLAKRKRSSKHKNVNYAFAMSDSEKSTVDMLFSKSCKLIATAAHDSDFPPENARIPEIAIAGRSNVGKSTLLKELLGYAPVKTDIKTQDRPGTTRLINMYDLRGLIRMVDLPGYGFAYAKQEEIDNWQALMRGYLSTRSALKCVLLLIDARHGPKAHDFDMMVMLDQCNVRYQVILTKTDLVEPVALAKMITYTQYELSTFACAMPHALPVSSKFASSILMQSQWQAGLYYIKREIASLIHPSKMPKANRPKKSNKNTPSPYPTLADVTPKASRLPKAKPSASASSPRKRAPKVPEGVNRDTFVHPTPKKNNSARQRKREKGSVIRRKRKK